MHDILGTAKTRPAYAKTLAAHEPKGSGFIRAIEHSSKTASVVELSMRGSNGDFASLVMSKAEFESFIESARAA